MLYDLFGLDPIGESDDEPRLFGIECECETVLPQAYAPGSAIVHAGWRTVSDGSLRNSGVEFLAGPVTSSTAMDMLDVLYAERSRYGFSSSIRTSMHVHANMHYETLESLRNIVAAYCLVEPVLMSLCGTDREENIYCVPFYRSSEPLVHLAGALVGKRGWNFQKYSALNLGALGKFGTLEFRHAPLWGYREQACLWLCLIEEFLEIARGITPTELLGMIDTRGVTGTIRHLLPTLPCPVQYEWDMDWMLDYDIFTTINILVPKTNEDAAREFKWKFINLQTRKRKAGPSVHFDEEVPLTSFIAQEVPALLPLGSPALLPLGSMLSSLHPAGREPAITRQLAEPLVSMEDDIENEFNDDGASAGGGYNEAGANDYYEEGEEDDDIAFF